jgi:hypothetical protein
MGMLKIETWGSFKSGDFQTCAEAGGHVAAIKRGIRYLADRLPEAVQKDAKLTAEGVAPPNAPLGEDE